MANSWFKQQDAVLFPCFFLLDVQLPLTKLLCVLQTSQAVTFLIQTQHVRVAE